MAGETQRVKRYLFNLIIYSHQNRRSEYFQHIVQAFIEKYPCKAIFIECGAQEESLDVQDASSLEQCDQVVIRVSEESLHKVPFVLLTKLIPDLPIYLVWGDNPTSDNEILPQLQKLATRFVFDAECVDNLGAFCASMLEKISTLKVDFMDISWANISGWRDAIAETFSMPEMLEYLNQCEHLIVKYNNAESSAVRHAAIQAIYIQGWLAAQLNWKFKAINYQESILLVYMLPESTLEVKLLPQERSTLERGKVFELEFHGKNKLLTTMTLAEKQSKIMVYLSTPEKCELPFSHPIPDMSKGLTAMKEVFYYRASRHYTNLLERLKDIPWKEF